jgi:superfamily II DNA/RNA helicase
MEPAQRNDILKEFISVDVRTLVTTDILTQCGINVQGGRVTLIINYDVPTSSANYIQRVGWFGRFGRKAIVIDFATKEDMGTFRGVEGEWCTSWRGMLRLAVLMLVQSFRIKRFQSCL